MERAVFSEDEQLTVQIGVALHKEYTLFEDPLYLPVWVGAALRGKAPEGWQRDDKGENISEKNPGYCELTAHYWLWKHSGADGIGLCHYRRYFSTRRLGPREKRVLTLAQAQVLLGDADALLPKKRHYWIETNESHYIHAHRAEDLAACRRAVAAVGGGAYLAAFDTVMRRRSGHRFNMLVMRRSLFCAYSEWLFSVLAEAERELEGAGRGTPRVYGFLAERLLDVWLEVNRPRVKELPVMNLESQHWPKKIAAFLKRKLRAGR